ncbi:MAG: HAD-IA family hydrolase [Solobacterium sp.]|nr:HAD-IA family hydrolase [Solobacterium sp.]
MIKAVFFDLGRTLVLPASNDWYFTPLFYRLVPQITPDAIRREPVQSAFRKAYQPLLEYPRTRDVPHQITRFTAFYDALLDNCGIPHDESLPRILAEDHAGNMNNMVLVPTARETLHALHEAGIWLGVISDTWPMIMDQLRALQIHQYFDAFTLSYELGTNKPSPAMFHDALSKASLPPHQCLFVDDVAEYLRIAEEFRIPAIQSVPDDTVIRDDRYPCIRCPAEILPYL